MEACALVYGASWLGYERKIVKVETRSCIMASSGDSNTSEEATPPMIPLAEFHSTVLEVVKELMAEMTAGSSKETDGSPLAKSTLASCQIDSLGC